MVDVLRFAESVCSQCGNFDSSALYVYTLYDMHINGYSVDIAPSDIVEITVYHHKKIACYLSTRDISADVEDAQAIVQEVRNGAEDFVGRFDPYNPLQGCFYSFFYERLFEFDKRCHGMGCKK